MILSTFARPFTLALALSLAGAAPLLAQGASEGPSASRAARDARGAERPALRLVVHENGASVLEVDGRPWARCLLLFGGLDARPQEDGRRVAPGGIIELELDGGGLGRLCVPRPGPATRLFAQAWQSTASAASGAFSPPVTLDRRPPRQASVARPRDLVITEFMKDPSAVTDGHGEWVEIYSTKPWRLDIEGVTLSDYSGASFTLDNGGQGILLRPGQHFVIGNDTDPATNGGVPVDWQWSGFSLKNSADEIVLHDSLGRYLDKVTYDDGGRWPDEAGRSISLTGTILSSVANNGPGPWCSSTSTIGTGPDTGTPGAANDVCP